MVKYQFRGYISMATYQTGLFLCLCILVFVMPVSTYIMSAIQLAMGGVWLITGHYKEKVLRFWRNRPALIFAGIYMVYVIGLIWSNDLAQGFIKDLRDKLPTLTLTILVASSRPLSLKQAHILLLLFSLSVTITSFIGFGIFLSGNYTDFRDISPFISHYYYSLMVLLTVFLLPWMVKRLSLSEKYYHASLIISGWLFFFLFILSSLQALLCLAGIVMFLLFRFIGSDQKKLYRMLTASLVFTAMAAALGTSVYLYNMVSAEVSVKPDSLYERTALGNPYTHAFDNNLRENGHYVYYFVAREELQEAWNERSDYEFEGSDNTGHELYATLYRYMASKGLRKDREGFAKMAPDDIRAVEQGIPNYRYVEWPRFVTRIHGSFWEVYWYRQTGNPTGHTLSQRLELWKASWLAFKSKPLIGWGTGDVFIAVDYGLTSLDSKLENYRMKPHNQYLVLLLNLGVVGTIAVFLLYFFFVKTTGVQKFLPYNIFLVMMLVAMIGNNPFDVQTGQTIFVFFSLYFGLIYKPALLPHGSNP